MNENDIAREIADLRYSMTATNWILVRNRLDMTREEIESDEGLMLVVYAWKKTGTTSDNLIKLMDTPEKELSKILGIDIDAALDEAIASA